MVYGKDQGRPNAYPVKQTSKKIIEGQKYGCKGYNLCFTFYFLVFLCFFSRERYAHFTVLNSPIITNRPARSAAMPVLFLLSGPKMGFSPRRGDTLPR